MPNSITYKSRGAVGVSGPGQWANGDTICYVSDVPEGYTKLKVHFEYDNVSNIIRTEIQINDIVVYTGSDYTDKTYAISENDCISAYTMYNRVNSSLDHNEVAVAYAYLTLSK